MRRILALILLLALCAVATGEVTIVGKGKYPDRQIIKLKVAGAKVGQISWDVFDKDRNRVEVEMDDRLQGELWFTAEPGVYTVEVIYVDFEAKKFDRGRKTIVIEGVVPPVPPIPPVPPTPPVPVDDPVARAFQAAYDTETDGTKVVLVKSLAALYRQAGTATFLDTCATGKDLFTAMSKAAGTLGLAGKLPALQKAVNTEMGKRFRLTEGQVLDAGTKITISAAFLKIAASLEGVRP